MNINNFHNNTILVASRNHRYLCTTIINIDDNPNTMCLSFNSILHREHMAVATNLGHIYYTREEYTKGECSMQIVLSTLLQCTTSTTQEKAVFLGHTTTSNTTHGRSRVLAGFFQLFLPPPPARAA